jgi:hypothetical protein
MIKKCKWCGKESLMNGKKEYCDKKCRKKYEVSQRRGKLSKKKFIDGLTGDESQNIVETLIGQLAKVTTTADQCLRLTVDVPIEKVNFDTIQYLNQKIVLGFVNDIKESDKKEEPEKKEVFDD